jgi:hypothetical protein
MGRLLIGGKFALVKSSSEDDFKRAREGNSGLAGAGFIDIPNYEAKRGVRGINKVQDTLAKQATFTDVTRNAPLFNDPRYTSSTLSIPTDERTLNGLYRFFAETDPIVGSAIKLQTELPLADLKLGQCEDPGVQQHYEEMWDRISGYRLLTDIASERSEIGNCYPFGAFNEHDYMWDQFAILNPDYVKVESTWINQKPLIKLIPDEALKKIVQTQSPSFIFKQLPPEIIKNVLFNQEIPLASNNTFHITHAKRPYELRGRSIIKRILKTLMLEDRFNQANFALATRHAVPITVVKVGDASTGWLPSNEEIDSVREAFSAYDLDPNFCYDEETECLTKDGWKKYTELSKQSEIACFNPKTNGLEYHKASYINIQDYDNVMYHFKTRGMDMKVTPNHRMWVLRDGKWQVVLAEDVKCEDQFRTVVSNFEYDEEFPKTINVGKYTLDMGDFFEFAGWYISEGSLETKHNYTVHITQCKEDTKEQIRILLEKCFGYVGYYGSSFQICGKDIGEFICNTFGKGSKTKFLPQWMLNAPKEYLERLFEAYRLGDGTQWKLKNKENFIVLASQSEALIDAFQIIALKLGYASRKRFLNLNYKKMVKGKYQKKNTPYKMFYLNVTKCKVMSYPKIPHRLKVVKEFPKLVVGVIPYSSSKRIAWDKVNISQLVKQTGGVLRPLVTAFRVNAGTITTQARKQGVVAKVGGEGHVKGGKVFEPRYINKVPYKGKIWCVTVPTGIIVTRRNGKVCIQGNSLFYHYGINIEFYGSNGRMLPVGPELDRIYRLKFIGLNMHEQLMTGAGGSYSQAYINLEVQRQRYLNLQLQLETFYHQGVCKPVADLCGFYRIKQPISSYTGVSSTRYGQEDRREIETLKQSSTLRDFQDNKEYKQYQAAKLAEIESQKAHQVREYIYPKLDWGGMNAATDENLKNYIKWLQKERPWLVDDATLARLGRLDRDTQEKAYIKDLERTQARYKELSKKGLLPFALQKGTQSPADMGGIGDINVGPTGGGEMAGPGMEGGEPNAPMGVGGPPEAANAQVPPAGVQSSLKDMEKDVTAFVFKDDMTIGAENKALQKAKEYESKALFRVVNR